MARRIPDLKPQRGVLLDAQGRMRFPLDLFSTRQAANGIATACPERSGLMRFIVCYRFGLVFRRCGRGDSVFKGRRNGVSGVDAPATIT